MGSDLKNTHNTANADIVSLRMTRRMGTTTTGLYIAMLLIIVFGTAFALFQNWQIRLKEARLDLSHDARMANFLIESSLSGAAKSLATTHTAFESAMNQGPISRENATAILNTSYAQFRQYNSTNVFGLIFFVDKTGHLFAQSNTDKPKAIDFSDRYYFFQLRDHPELSTVIGPMIHARTTGQWVFHMSRVLRDKAGAFQGVLVQQISHKDIAQQLAQYTDDRHFEQLLTHVEDVDLSFALPQQGQPNAPSHELLTLLERNESSRELIDDSFTLEPTPGLVPERLLIGVNTTDLFQLETYVAIPYGVLWQAFLGGSLYLIIYSASSMVLVTWIYIYLKRLSRRVDESHTDALTDPLTQIHNRRALDEYMPQMLRESMRELTPISVLFIDIDHFRYFNETFGHESGDVALKAVAKALASCARRPLDLVCRWGGEEFVVLLPKTNSEGARTLAQSILQAVRATQLVGPKGEHPTLTVSVGHASAIISDYPPSDDLVDMADKAMLKAKAQGRNQAVEYIEGQMA